jgi:glycosidase
MSPPWNFWLRKGVDGFRVDTVNMYSKEPGFRDAPITEPGAEWQHAADYYCNGPRIYEYLREMNYIFSKYGAMTVGELLYTPDVGRVLKYVSARDGQLNMVLNSKSSTLALARIRDTTPFPGIGA